MGAGVVVGEVVGFGLGAAAPHNKNYGLYLQSVIVQMSFFERMMRINQPHPHPPSPQQSSRSNPHESQEEEEVPEEPKPQGVYASVKPVLLSHLLPKREQLLRDMLARKREFELKKLSSSNVNKGAQLKQRLAESSSHFVHAIQTPIPIPPQAVIQSNDSNKALMASAANFPQSNVGKKSLKESIVQKSLKESLVLQISASSRRKDSDCSNTGVNGSGGDGLSRQIMLRLLSMLQNERIDRKDLLAMSISNHYSLPHEKEQPIVINNILKTPVDALNKDLIEREMKIRLLEDHRIRSKQSLHPARTANVDLTSDQPLTQRSDLPNCQEFTPTEQRLSTHQGQHGKKAKISLECSRISIESRLEREAKGREGQREGREGQREGKGKEGSPKEEECTKPCSNFSSQITETEPSHPPNQRERHFHRPKHPSNKNQAKPNPPQAQKQRINNQEGSSPTVCETIVHKASIRLEIPLNDSSEGEGLTLAQAFKKRIGRLKSEKDKEKERAKKATAVGVISDESFVKTELYPEYKTPKDPCIPLFPLESSQTVNLHKHAAKTRTPQQKPQIFESAKQASSSKSGQPAKGLIDRLIGGERAKVSKKEMYALTRKNYENLPEVQAKKREGEKREVELKRLAKIRELQRSTRSLKGASMHHQSTLQT